MTNSSSRPSTCPTCHSNDPGTVDDPCGGYLPIDPFHSKDEQLRNFKASGGAIHSKDEAEVEEQERCGGSPGNRHGVRGALCPGCPDCQPNTPERPERWSAERLATEKQGSDYGGAERSKQEARDKETADFLAGYPPERPEGEAGTRLVLDDYRRSVIALEARLATAEQKLKGTAIARGQYKAERDRAEAQLDQAREALEELERECAKGEDGMFEHTGDVSSYVRRVLRELKEPSPSEGEKDE